MHLSGLKSSPNPCYHIRSLVTKHKWHKCLGTILQKYKQSDLSDKSKNYTVGRGWGGERLSSQNIESNDSFYKIKCSEKHQGTCFRLQLA